MRFKLPRFLRSEAVGRDRAQLPGFETIELTTGEEARETLQKVPWDLAILDRRLPDMGAAAAALTPPV